MLFYVHDDYFSSFGNCCEKLIGRTRKAALVKNGDRPVFIGVNAHRSVKSVDLIADLKLKQRRSLFYVETAKA